MLVPVFVLVYILVLVFVLLLVLVPVHFCLAPVLRKKHSK
jgi:hypothetical protein